MPFLYIDKQSGISRAVAALHQVGAGHRVPLLQALHRGRITLLEARRPGSSKLFKLWAATAARTPAVALIGDDDCASPDGPDTWPIAPRMLRWARFILIHGGGQPDRYEHAVRLAEASGRLMMVECSSANVEAWQEAAARWAVNAQGEVMRPPPESLHPSLDKGHVQ